MLLNIHGIKLEIFLINKIYIIRREVPFNIIFDFDNLELIWERPKEMEKIVITLDQIAEKFGVQAEQIEIAKS